MKVAKNENQRL